MLVIWKFAKSIADRTKRPRGPRTARVFDTPHLTQLNKKKQDHPFLFSKLAKQTNHGLLIFAFRAMLAECLTWTFWLTDRDAGTKPSNRDCPG